MMIESFWPTTGIGWLTFGTLSIAVGKTGYDWLTGRRKSLAALQDSIKALDRRMDNFGGKIDDLEGRLEAVDGLATSVRELTQEWRGVAGDNGYKNIIRENTRAIADIVRRNDRLDAIREEDERRSGGQHRRKMDRELDRLLPEKREEEG